MTWYAISYEQAAAILGNNPAAFFATDDKSLNGNTGRNDYTGTYTVNGGTLLIGGVSGGRKLCGEA